ncbi:mechanosensitive ion channel family protein [Methylacidimicrobium sp. B4]|uniref:mechanosensitive ion channel family protein n=1 Tax=Methylacidimicrobium sp. B4 TaxID=2796139 RepID=UPI001A8F6DFA|nr:mechanosensitive ion channel family protein [Methylacidimicrobium sp. B4]QSR84232.1 mechanosensitive ion channel family protein [Methylacidimicrobium sp. B4]
MKLPSFPSWQARSLEEGVIAIGILALAGLIAALLKRWHPHPIPWRVPGEAEGWKDAILCAAYPPLEAGLLETAILLAVLALSDYLRRETGYGLPRLSIAVGLEIVWSLASWWFLARFAAICLGWVHRRTSLGRGDLASILFPRLVRFVYLLVPAIGLLAVESFPLPHLYRLTLHKVLAIYAIGLVGLAAGQSVAAGADWILRRCPLTQSDPAAGLRSRKLHTQVRVASRVLFFVIGLLTFAAVLMLFSEVRHLGASLLASAGIVGVIGGLAAQRTIGNIFAGLQIAWTQPVRLGDIVVVEGQWGTIEEITLTYVVVAIWDQIRLVLPISYLIEHPFQNWTRNSSELLGTAHVFVDYTMPVEEMRNHLREICRNNPLWDGRVAVTQVTHATERTMNVRLLVSAQDSSKLWDLRCAVREQMIAFVRDRFPECLPKIRAEWDALPDQARSELLDG